MSVSSFVRTSSFSSAIAYGTLSQRQLRSSGCADSRGTGANPLPPPHSGRWFSFEGNRQFKIRSFVQPGEPSIGHFGFFNSRYEQKLWRIPLEWLKFGKAANGNRSQQARQPPPSSFKRLVKSYKLPLRADDLISLQYERLRADVGIQDPFFLTRIRVACSELDS